MGISAQVLKDPFGALEGGLTIDDPLFTIELAPESFKVPRLLEMGYSVGEYKSTRLETSFKKIQELPFEQRRQDPDRDKKPFAGYDPTASVGGESTPGDDTVEVGVTHEVLSPGMENADYAYHCTEMFRIVCEFGKCFGDRTEKKII